MHRINFRTVPMLVACIGTLAGCHQDRSQEAVLQPEPSRNPQQDNTPVHPPMVKGDLTALPELMIEMDARYLENASQPMAVEMPVAADKSVEEKRAKLKKITSENQDLAQRIKVLEQELVRKDEVSRQITQKIEGLKSKTQQ